jgi:hypothetical protein
MRAPSLFADFPSVFVRTLHYPFSISLSTFEIQYHKLMDDDYYIGSVATLPFLVLLYISSHSTPFPKGALSNTRIQASVSMSCTVKA